MYLWIGWIMRAFINIIILILLSLSLYVIPLNTNAFDFETANILDDEAESNISKYECIFTKITDDNFLYNPKTYELKIDSNIDFPQDLNKKLTYVLEFTDFNDNKTTFKEDDLGQIIYDKESKGFNIKLDLLKARKKLACSTYSVNLKINCFNDIFEDNFKVFFEKDKISLQDNTSPNFGNLQELYYSDKSMTYSIPVYRDKVYFSNVFVDVLYSLNNKPEELEKAGLLNPKLDLYYIPNMWFQNGKLKCGFYESNIAKIKNKKQAEILIKNLIDSYGKLPTYNIVNEFEVFINGSDKKDIAGYSIKESFKVNRSPKVYLPIFLSNNKYFWVPVDIEIGEKIEDDVLKMFEIYKSSPEYMKDSKFISLFPNLKVYKKITIVDDKLVVDLSDEMYEFLNRNTDYLMMIKESLALSFSSIDGIKGYELWYENNLVEEINDVELGANILAPSSFNMLN